jgi:hypothetical protein
VTAVAWACFTALVVLVLVKIGAGELGRASRRVLRAMDISSAAVATLLVALLALRILTELG